MSEQETDARPFRRVVYDRVRLFDLAVLAVVPLVLLAVFWLPAPTRRSLVFAYRSPSLLTSFTSTYVHLDTGHLLSNLGGYVLVVPVTYVLSTVSGRRRRFLVAASTFLLVFPPLLAGFDLLFVRRGVSVGFSGVLLAFYGYLPMALADHLDAHFGIRPKTSTAPVLFFSGSAVVAVLGVRPALADPTVRLGTAGLVVATVFAALLFAVDVVDRENGRPRLRTETGIEPGYFELAAVALFLLFAVPFVAFPANPVGERAVSNTYLHLLAYALAFSSTYATVHVLDRGFDSEMV